MKLAFVTVLAIASFTSNLAPGWTQPSSPVIAELPPPPGTGTPSGSQGTGGTRRYEQIGTCKQTDKPLTALVPEKGNQGLTTAEHPVFWFYIPYAPEDIHSIEFSVQNWDEQTTVYQTSVQLSQTPGIIGISLPPSPKHSLKLNKSNQLSYQWSLNVNCKAKQPSEQDDMVLDGWVTRVQPSPKLVGVIWYDELTNRAKRYLSAPQNIEVKKAWAELLESVGLKGLAQEPVVSSSSNSEDN